MKGAHRHHPAYWAFVLHRLSGVGLALFLPLHFLTLGLALEGHASLDQALAWFDAPLVKAAELGLVVLLRPTCWAACASWPSSSCPGVTGSGR